jgi:hypothetical protein
MLRQVALSEDLLGLFNSQMRAAGRYPSDSLDRVRAVQDLVDDMDQVLSSGRCLLPFTSSTRVQAILSSNPGSHLIRVAIADLRQRCKSHGILPRSCKLVQGIRIKSLYPLTQSGLSDVWCGELEQYEKPVAVKSLRIHMGNREAVIKVRCAREYSVTMLTET